MNSHFSVEHHCPQCGAPIFLDETDRFFVCPFCRVRSCISQKGFGRYYLTPHSDIPKVIPLVYLPYWRFKGIQYACSQAGVDHWFTDLSILAVDGAHRSIPFSLGFRSQTLTLKRVSVRTKGTFIRPLAFKESLAALSKRSRQNRESKSAVISEDIGETFSLIYAPFYQKEDRLIDAVLNTPLDPPVGKENFFTTMEPCRPEKETQILSGVCPGCGWDLEGQSDSLVLICSNCQTLWQARQDRLDRIRFRSARPETPEDVLIPFWKVTAGIGGMDLASYEDLIRLGNLPKVIQPETPHQDIFFWAPAFKIRPKIFLRISRQLTLDQPAPGLDKRIRKNQHLPITLPATEAIQSIKITLASLARPLKDHLQNLAAARIKPTEVSLIFLPFEAHHHEFIHRGLNLAINTNVLKLSGNL